MLTLAVETFLEIARDASATDEEVAEAANALFAAFQEADTPSEVLDAQSRLTQVLNWPLNAHSQLAAVVSGALVENGLSPEPLLAAFEPRLQRWIPLAQSIVERLPNAEEEGTSEGAWLELAASHPTETDAVERLETFFLPLVAALSQSPEGRHRLRPLRESLDALGDHLDSAGYLKLLLGVLDDEPLLVIEVDARRGFIGNFSGVADVFQLHALLMDVFSDHDGVPRISSRAAAVARGEDEQTTEETVLGVWNLFQWTALSSGGTLPTSFEEQEHWIWNEDTPDDIAIWNDQRVVLLGPAPYERYWQAQRLFAALPAQIAVERWLSPSEVEQYLQQMAVSQ